MKTAKERNEEVEKEYKSLIDSLRSKGELTTNLLERLNEVVKLSKKINLYDERKCIAQKRIFELLKSATRIEVG